MTDAPEESPVMITALSAQTENFTDLLEKNKFAAAIEVCEVMLKDMEPEQKHWNDLRAQAQMARTRADHLVYMKREWEELDLRLELLTEHHEEYLEELRAEHGRGLERLLYGRSSRGDEQYLCTERHMVRSSGAIDFCFYMTDEAELMHFHWLTRRNHGPEDKSFLELYPQFFGVWNYSNKIHRPGHKHAGDSLGEAMYYIDDKLVFPARETWRNDYNLCWNCYPSKRRCDDHMRHAKDTSFDADCSACRKFFTG